MFDLLIRMSKPVVLIEKLPFISGREAQDTGQVQPTFDRETVCGSHHHRKGVFFGVLLQSSKPRVA